MVCDTSRTERGPGAAFFYTDELTSHSYHSFSQKLGSQALTLSEEVEYNLTVRVEQTGLYDRIYSFKIWEAGTAEPAGAHRMSRALPVRQFVCFFATKSMKYSPVHTSTSVSGALSRRRRGRAG